MDVEHPGGRFLAFFACGNGGEPDQVVTIKYIHALDIQDDHHAQWVCIGIPLFPYELPRFEAVGRALFNRLWFRFWLGLNHAARLEVRGIAGDNATRLHVEVAGLADEKLATLRNTLASFRLAYDLVTS